MGKLTTIGWTNHTFNVAWGCWKLSPGCLNCYADNQSRRYGHHVWGQDAPRRTFGAKHWAEPIKWNAAAAQAEERRRVFCSSMTDVCLDDPTIIAEMKKLWPLIRATPWLDWQLLTKRPERYEVTLPDDWDNGYPNVWLGTSIESNDYIARADALSRYPATVRFISYEPAIGPLDRLKLDGIDWVIYGGESGGGYRAEDKAWARQMEEMCEEETLRRILLGDLLTDCVFFHKQSNGLHSGTGVELDGRIIQEYPHRRLALPVI